MATRWKKDPSPTGLARVTAGPRGSGLLIDGVVARIADVCSLRIQGEPSNKPHGRKAWSLLLPGFSEVRWVDMSAFAPVQPTSTGE